MLLHIPSTTPAALSIPALSASIYPPVPCSFSPAAVLTLAHHHRIRRSAWTLIPGLAADAAGNLFFSGHMSGVEVLVCQSLPFCSLDRRVVGGRSHAACLRRKWRSLRLFRFRRRRPRDDGRIGLACGDLSLTDRRAWSSSTSSRIRSFPVGGNHSDDRGRWTGKLLW